MSEETKKKTAPKKAAPKVDHKEQFAQHQEYAVLLLQFNNLKPDAKKKFKRADRLKELEGIVKKFDGKLANSKKDKGVSKMSVKGTIVLLTQEMPNPKSVIEKFPKDQVSLYFK